MHLTQLSEEDVPEVVESWNAVLPHDPTTEERFRRQVLGDPNYEPEGVVIWRDGDGSVQGLSACFLRRTVEGGEGGGHAREFNRGFLKGFFVCPGPQESAVAAQLLAASEAYCRAAGKTELRVTEYTYDYAWPGIDLRYEHLREILVANGYRDVRTIEDVAVELGDPGLPGRLQTAGDRAGQGVEVLTWRPELLEPMRRFVAEGQVPAWFPAGWEKRMARPREEVLVLRRGEEIVGWAGYWPGRPRASFGPVLVLERERGKGYGVLLLLECMLRAKERGAERMTAGWANTGFYVAAGWHIYRRYAVLTKDLQTPQGAG
jgi:GNAT superfamily N-acetyltransferase